MIDGGCLRQMAKDAGQAFTPATIDAVARHCVGADEEALRYLFYDCKPYAGTVTLPVSGGRKDLSKMSGKWLDELAARELFAVRLGVLKFRGFKLKRETKVSAQLTDGDFYPDFEQKGVDMRIGLDIATYSTERLVSRIVLLTLDTDVAPALKHARKSGVQVVIAHIAGANVPRELKVHSDYLRPINWPPSPPAP